MKQQSDQLGTGQQRTDKRMINKGESCIIIRSFSYKKRISFHDGPKDLNNIDIVSNQDGDPVQVKPHVQTYIHKLNMGRKNKTANNGFGTRPRGFFGYAQTPSATAFQSTNYASQQDQNEDYSAQQQEEGMAEGQGEENNRKLTAKDHFFLNFMHSDDIPKINPNMIIPSEEEINQTYSLKLPVLVSKMENENAQMNLLNGWSHNFVLVEGYIQMAQRYLQKFIELKEQLKQEQIKIQDHFNNEQKQIQEEAAMKLQDINQRLQDDFVKHQTEQFRLQKEITILQRDRDNLEKDIETATIKLNQLESRMYGAEVFNLQTDDPNLQNLTLMNLRSDSAAQTHTTIKNVIH